MVIYIDVVFLENIIMNYIILFATNIILKQKTKHIRMIIASAIGAIYTVLAYVTNIEIYSNIIIKFILSIVIVYVAYNPQKLKAMWKQLLFFYITSFLFGGVAFALIYIIKPQDILIKNGLFLGTYPLKVVVLGGIVAFVIIVITVKIIKEKIKKKTEFIKIRININKKTVETIAMIDTGNLLKEPISNIPVIVVEKTLLYNILPQSILNNITEILKGNFDNIPPDEQLQYCKKLKFIPFSSLGKEHGMLLGIKPDFVEIIKEESDNIEINKYENIIIGIYNRQLSKNGEYKALVGPIEK